MKLLLILDILRTLGQMRQREHWTRAQLLDYQARALERQRAYAYAHSPFYQRFHQGLTDRPLHELPVLTKAVMMEHFDDLVTDRAIRLEAVREHARQDNVDARFLDRTWVTATSGSSGHPGFFVYNRAEWVQLVASFARGQEWSGNQVSPFQRQRMATVASTSAWHVSSQVAYTAKSWWRPSIRIAASDPLPDIVRRLNDWQPQVLICYASMVRILADEQLAGRLDIHPQVTFTSSEVLTDETRRHAERAWGHAPFNQYGATETANIAAECREGHRLHLYEDLIITEVVDEHYQPVPVGEAGAKILVTTLFSRTQPLIRYELNDSVRLTGEACPACGRPFAALESIEGRVEDTLYLPAADGGQVPIRPLVFNRIMDILPVSGWQVVQEAERLRILLVVDGAHVDEGALAETVRSALELQGAVAPPLLVERVAAIPKTSSGKVPQIKALKQN